MSFERTISPEDLEELKRRRETADAAYNEALSALDATLQRLETLPTPPPPFDDSRVRALNQTWDLAALTPRFDAGWRGRVQRRVWAMVAPLFERQHTFNATLVDHMNRDLEPRRELTESVREVVQRLREALAGLVSFETRLMLFAQQLTPYIDTKDHEVMGLMRRINEDVAEVSLGLAATVNGLADELRKRWETTLAGQRRLDGRMDELQTTAAVAHQAAQTLKRELARLGPPAADRPRSDPSVASPPVGSSPLDSYKYVGFENLFRGSPDEIRARLESYAEYFEGATDVLDAGCGRGEFLEILRKRGIVARGIDLNHEMVEHCRARGLTVDERDVRSYLREQADRSLGGLFASQVVEHLEPDYLLETLDLAFHKLRPGTVAVLETINVASWSAFFHSYLRDITHVRPLHPDTLRYLATASGFQNVTIVYRSPCAPQERLETVPEGAVGADVVGLAQSFNENVEKLNRLLFSPQDYAIVAQRR